MTTEELPKCDEVLRLAEAEDWDGVVNHVKQFCHKCNALETELKISELDERELLFLEEDPSWLTSDSDEDENEAEAVEQAKPKKVKKLGGNKKELIIGEEAILKHLEKMNEDRDVTDNMLEYEVKRYRHLSDELARKEVIQMRRRRREKWKKEREEGKATEQEEGEMEEEEGESASEKETEAGAPERTVAKPDKPVQMHMGKPANVPWMPPIPQIFPKVERSVLTDEDQKRIVGILKNFISTKTFRFTGNKEDLKLADRKLAEERERLHEMIVKEYPMNHVPTVPFYVHTYMQGRWGLKWQTAANLKFKVKPLVLIPWPRFCEPVSSTNGPDVVVTLNEGRCERFQAPNLDVRVPLDTRIINDKYNASFSNKCPIEEDEDAAEMCIYEDVPIAMDASTASYLMTNSFLGRPHDVCFSVTVQTKLHKGSVRKLIFVSKPKVYGKQRNLAFMRSYAKYAFKSHFVEKRRKDIEESHTMLLDLEKPRKKETKKATSPSGESNDMLGSILSEIDSNKTADQPTGPKTGKRYSVFSFGSHNALIRSSAPLKCDFPKIPVLHNKTITVQPFIELAPCVGATCLSEEEMLFNQCKMVFKQADVHALLRIGIEQDNKMRHGLQLLQIHPLLFFTDKTSADDEKHLKRIFRERTARMESLLVHLMALDNGIYLMREMGDKLAIVEREAGGKGGEFDCKNKHKSLNPGLEPQPFEEVFPGIDTRMLLQWQVYLNRVPGSFLAADCPAARAVDKYRITPTTANVSGTRPRKQKHKKRKRASAGGNGQPKGNIPPNPESNRQMRKRAMEEGKKAVKETKKDRHSIDDHEESVLPDGSEPTASPADE